MVNAVNVSVGDDIDVAGITVEVIGTVLYNGFVNITYRDSDGYENTIGPHFGDDVFVVRSIADKILEEDDFDSELEEHAIADYPEEDIKAVESNFKLWKNNPEPIAELEENSDSVPNGEFLFNVEVADFNRNNQHIGTSIAITDNDGRLLHSRNIWDLDSESVLKRVVIEYDSRANHFDEVAPSSYATYHRTLEHV